MSFNKVNISIIIPVYNLEKYIITCLDSIIKINCEIILINDGSSDRSLELILRYKYEHSESNIVIINQDNHGLAYSRNYGVLVASNDYVTFLDGDDIIYSDVLIDMLNICENNNLDVAYGGYFDKYLDTGVLQKPLDFERFTEKNIVLTGEKYLYTALKQKMYNLVAVAKIYRKKFLLENKLFFEEGRTYEDHLFTFAVVNHAQRVMQLNVYPYVYQHRNGSITSIAKEKHVIDLLHVISCFRDKKINIAKSERYKLMSISYYHLISVLCRLNKNTIKYYSKKICKLELSRCICNAYDKHVCLKLTLFSISPMLVKRLQKQI